MKVDTCSSIHKIILKELFYYEVFLYSYQNEIIS